MIDSSRSPQLGKYRLVAQLGEGGTALVYLAVAAGAGGVSKLLVVKALKDEIAKEPEFVAMFLDEARLSTRLNHPAIVQTIEVGEQDEMYFTVMEYLEGKPLNRLNRGKIPGLTQNSILHLVAEALGGLHYAHELADYDGSPLGIVHRDVSPHNVFVTYDGHAKIVDFGVAKIMSASVKTEMGVIKGKPTYMAPEHARGQTVDRRADVFSVGVILYEAVTGQRLWTGKHDMAVLFAVCNAEIPSVLDTAPATPPELARIVTKALAPAKEDRYPSAQALQEDLEAYLRSTGELVSPREIGRVLREHFATDRAQIKAAVDAQLKAMTSASTGEFKLVALPNLDATGSNASAADGDSPLRGTRTPSSKSLSLAHNVTGTHPSRANELPKRNSTAIAGAAIAVAVIAVVGWAATRGRASELTARAAAQSVVAPEARPAIDSLAADASPAPQTSPTSQPADEPDMVVLTMRASPPEARLMLDGKRLETNPYTGRFAKDGAKHALRVEAAGFTAREEPVSFDKDAFFDLALAKPGARAPVFVPQKRSNAPTPAAAAPSPTPAIAAPPSATANKKKRAVDPTDPYAQ